MKFLFLYLILYKILVSQSCSCVEGYGCNTNGICEPCTPGYFSSGGPWPCAECQPGFYCNANQCSDCTPCAPGTATNQYGETICPKCKLGTYAADPQSTECSKCDVNTYTPARGATECIECYSGCKAGAKTCGDAARKKEYLVVAIVVSVIVMVLFAIGGYYFWGYIVKRTRWQGGQGVPTVNPIYSFVPEDRTSGSVGL